MTINGFTVGMRLPMLRSATGKAYLANCEPSKRQLILENLRRTGHPDDARAHDARYVKNLVASTLKLGYGERHDDWMIKTGAIAILLRHEGRVLACLNTTFIASVISTREAAERYLRRCSLLPGRSSER